jgi:hypothetical protein
MHHTDLGCAAAETAIAKSDANGGFDGDRILGGVAGPHSCVRVLSYDAAVLSQSSDGATWTASGHQGQDEAVDRRPARTGPEGREADRQGIAVRLIPPSPSSSH